MVGVAIYRLTGIAESVTERKGTSRAGKPYSIPECVVRVNEMIATVVTLSDAMRSAVADGDQVDFVVDVGKSQTGFDTARVTGMWPKDQFGTASSYSGSSYSSAS